VEQKGKRMRNKKQEVKLKKPTWSGFSFTPAEIRLIQKDYAVLWNRKGIRTLLMLLPFLLVVAIPAIYIVAVNLLPVPENAEISSVILDLLGNRTEGMRYRQIWFDAFVTLLCPVLYLAVPVICSVVSGAVAFMVEKEEHTLETVLLSSMGQKSVFRSKILGCTLLSVFFSFLSFLAFMITVTVGNMLLSSKYFLTPSWVLMVLLLMPALSFFSVCFVSLVMRRVYSSGEMLQTMGYLLLPILALYLIQLSGLIYISFWFLLVVAILVAAASVIIFRTAEKKFYPERVVPSLKYSPKEDI
jgi:MFS family permease